MKAATPQIKKYFERWYRLSWRQFDAKRETEHAYRAGFKKGREFERKVRGK